MRMHSHHHSITTTLSLFSQADKTLFLLALLHRAVPSGVKWWQMVVIGADGGVCAGWCRSLFLLMY